MPQKKINIEGMHCRSCEILLEDDLGKLPRVTRVSANFKKGEAVLSYDGEAPGVNEISRVIEQAGYRLGSANRAKAQWFSRDVTAYGRLLFGVVSVFILTLILRETGWFSLTSIGTIDASELPLVFAVGLTAGVSTCAALVGGLVLATAARYNALHPELSPKQKLIPHFWFQLGRIGGFFVLGMLLGLLGEWLSGSIVFTAFLTLGAGAVMLFLGLQLTNLFPRLSNWSLSLPKGLARFLGFQNGGATTYSHRGAVLGGALTFFLPCGFTQAVQLSVIALGQPLIGGLIMAVFALGTLPGLLALGGLASFISGRGRFWLFPIIAVVLIAFGVWNIGNGLHLFGINTTPSSTVGESGVKAAAPVENGVQVVRIIQDARGYHPSVLPTLKAGVPAKLIIDSQDSYTCASSFVIPEFGIKRQLKPGENIIEFTPKKEGRLPFSCSMGMFRGAIEVQ